MARGAVQTDRTTGVGADLRVGDVARNRPGLAAPPNLLLGRPEVDPTGWARRPSV